MIVDKIDRPLVIDLTGPQGNAFYLMGFAQKNRIEIQGKFFDKLIIDKRKF